MGASGDSKLQKALRDLTAALRTTNTSWMIFGGIAIIARGVRRFTSDIDATLRGDEAQLDELVVALAKKHIVPRISDAAQFARESLVLLMRHAPTGVDFDLSFAWTNFEHSAIAAATNAKFGSVSAPMAQAKDLVVYKAVAGRGKDVDDLVALLTLYPKINLARAREDVRVLADLADKPEAIRLLEKAIQTAKKAAVTAKKKSK